MDRFGWTLDAVRDGTPLATLQILVRQPAWKPAGREGISTADMDLIDWMDERGIEPGESF